MRRKHNRQLLLVAIVAALMGCLSAAAQNIPPGVTCVQATYPENTVAVGGPVTVYCPRRNRVSVPIAPAPPEEAAPAPQLTSAPLPAWPNLPPSLAP